MLPLDIWLKIMEFLPLGDLKTTALVSNLLHSASIPSIYGHVRFRRLATFEQWKGFVDRIEFYYKYIQKIDEIRLYLGDHLADVEDGRPAKYTGMHLVDYLFKGACLKHLSLQFASACWGIIDWRFGLQNLQSLKLRMKITDDILEKVLVSETNLTRLELHNACISHSSIGLISTTCKMLKKLVILAPTNNNQSSLDSDWTLSIHKLFCSLSELESLDINCTPINAEGYLELRGPKIREISFNLNQSLEMPDLLTLLPRFPNCKTLAIYGSNEDELEATNHQNLIFSIPDACPKLQEINLVNTAISTLPIGCTAYKPWIEEDPFVKKFRLAFPSITLNSYSR